MHLICISKSLTFDFQINLLCIESNCDIIRAVRE